MEKLGTSHDFVPIKLRENGEDETLVMCQVNLHQDGKKFTPYEILLTWVEMMFQMVKKIFRIHLMGTVSSFIAAIHNVFLGDMENIYLQNF